VLPFCLQIRHCTRRLISTRQHPTIRVVQVYNMTVPPPPPPVPPAPGTSSGPATGAIIGIVVGVVAAVTVFLLLACARRPCRPC